MIELSVSDPTDQIIKAMQDLPSKVVKPALMRALNRSATATRAKAVKEIRQEMGVSAATVREGIKLERAQARRLAAILRHRGRRLNLIRFGARQTKKGVSAKAWGKRRTYRGAFIVKERTVFTRERGAGRLPIRPMYGPGIVQTAIDRDVYRNLRNFTNDEFKKVLVHEINFRMQKLARKGAPNFKKVAA